MVAELREELNARLPPRYAAAIDLFVWIHEPDANTRTLLGKPDVRVVHRTATTGPASTRATMPAPTSVILPAIHREGSKYVKVFDIEDRRVVTVIELLSPANKQASNDREACLMKRYEYLANGVNLVEIDLLRTGERLPLGEGPLPTGADYYIMVCRATELPRAGVWPLSVRDRLPESPIPLDPEEVDLSLPLKPCMDRAYDKGRYAGTINYGRPPTPALRDADAVWALELLSRKRD